MSPRTNQTQLIQALITLPSFITTVSATFLIALKIILATCQSHRGYHYTRIIEILVQSSAIVCLVEAALAIICLVNFVQPFDLGTTSGKFGWQLYNLLLYAQTPILVSTMSAASIMTGCSNIFHRQLHQLLFLTILQMSHLRLRLWCIYICNTWTQTELHDTFLHVLQTCTYWLDTAFRLIWHCTTARKHLYLLL